MMCWRLAIRRFGPGDLGRWLAADLWSKGKGRRKGEVRCVLLGSEGMNECREGEIAKKKSNCER
jgi:hypothetical protein